MELYSHNQEFLKFLVWNIVEQFDRARTQDDQNFTINEDTLKNALIFVLRNTED